MRRLRRDARQRAPGACAAHGRGLGGGCDDDAAAQAFALELGAEWAGDALGPAPEELDAALIFAPAGELVPVALRAVRSGVTVACAGIHMSDIPLMTYREHLFHEKKLRSVEANTRADGEGLLAEAADIPIRPVVTRFALEDANDALVALSEDRIDGTGVLVVDA